MGDKKPRTGRARTPVLLRWGRHHALVLCAAALAVLLAATVLAALAALTEKAVEGGIQRRLAADQAASLRVLGDHPKGSAVAADYARTDAGVRAAFTRAFGDVPHRTVPVLRSPSSFAGGFGVTDTGGRELDDLTVSVVAVGGPGAAARPAKDQDARLVAGAWPRAGAAGGRMEAALPVALAARLALRPGDAFTVVLADGSRVRARMTGSFDTGGGNPALWRAAAGSFGVSTSLVLVAHEAFVAEPRLVRDTRDLWVGLPRAERIRLGDIEPLRDRLLGFTGSDTNLSVFRGAEPPPGPKITVDGSLASALDQLTTPIAVSRAGLYIPASLLAALAAAALVLTARQLAEHRRPELALLAARGAGTPRIAGSAVAHWIAVAVPAGLAAPFLAGPLLGVLGRAGFLPGDVPQSALLAVGWAMALLAVLVHGAAMLAPAVRAAGDGEAVAKLRRRMGRWAGAQRAGTDLALAVVAVLGWLQLQQYRTPVGDAGVDPVLVLAPVTMTCASALLVLRLLPLVARITEPLAGRGRGLVLPLGGWQVGRRATGHAGPTLVVALALAVGALSSTSLAMLDRGDHDQAVFQVGADLTISPSPTGGVPSGERRAAFQALPGVRSVTPVFDTRGTLDQASVGITALNTSTGPAPAVRPDLVRRPVAELLAPLGKNIPDHGIVLGPQAHRGGRDRLPLRVRLSADGPGKPAPVRLAVDFADGDGLVSQSAVLLPVDAGRARTVRLPLPVHADDTAPVRIVRVALSMQGETVQRTYRLTVDGLPGLGERPLWLDYELGNRVPRAAAGCPGAGPPLPGSPTPSGPVLCTDTGKPGTLLDSVVRGPVLPAEFPKWGVSLVPTPAQEAAAPMPALATDALFDSQNLREGSVLKATVSGRLLRFRIVGRIAAVPGTERAEPRLLADSRAFTAQLVLAGGLSEDERTWWVSVRDGDSAAALRTARQKQYGTVVDVPQVQRALADDPLREGSRGALTLCLMLAPAFAVVAFTLHTALSARARQREFALLRALGVRRGQLAAYLWTEQLVIAAVAAVLGTCLGTVLASAIMPLVTVDAGGSPVFPWLRTEIPWGKVGLTVGATTALICGVVTLAARFLARTDLARVLRAGEDR
ncbi:ABC transporter permease [Streptomyces sp. NPDC087440]|uniref:ABC transporter permease n=1 Tax=Streptomyces sp. NPDC087440 TaxID=3365790 RepID=UPI0037F1707C